VQNDEDDTIAIMQLVVLYQDIHVKDDTIAVMQLVVLIRNDDHDTIAIMQLVVLYAIVPYHRIDSNMAMINESNMAMINEDSTRKNGETKVVNDVPTDIVPYQAVTNDIDIIQYDYASNDITTTTTTTTTTTNTNQLF
jgi:hypothetical protein